MHQVDLEVAEWTVPTAPRQIQGNEPSEEDASMVGETSERSTPKEGALIDFE